MIDQAHNLIVLRYTGDGNGAGTRRTFIDMLRDEYNGFNYDMLIDLNGLERSFSVAKIDYLANLWHDYARGRDIGRRIAIVGAELGQKELIVAFPHRDVAVFVSYKLGMEWLLSPFNAEGEGQGVQLI